MAKAEQRRVARTLFVQEGKNRKEIAERVGVREKTVGDWASEGNWEALRTEHLLSAETVITNLKRLVSDLAKRRTAMEHDSSSPEDKRGVTDELSKATKALSEAKGEGELSLGIRLKVMGWVFDEMRKSHRAIHDQLIDFQEALLEEAARLHA